MIKNTKNLLISLFILMFTNASKINAIGIFNNRYKDINLDLNQQNISFFKDSTKLNDLNVLKNHSLLFQKLSLGSTDNIATNPNSVLWLNVNLNHWRKRDLIIHLPRYYKSVTVYYYDQNQKLTKLSFDNSIKFSDLEFYSSDVVFNYPNNSMNGCFIKYEFNEEFLVAGFFVCTFAQWSNSNLIDFINISILLTSIFIIFLWSSIFAIISREVKNFYYGLYALTFGFFSLSSFKLWTIFVGDFTGYNTLTFYIPFSISTFFFALYAISSIDVKIKELKIYLILRILLVIKALSIILPIFININGLINLVFNKTDVLIYGLIFILMVNQLIKKQNIVNWWMTIGVLVMFCAQFFHLFYNSSHWIFNFMFLDILWFGIGISMHYRISNLERVSALNEVIVVKSNYSQELEKEVEQRTIEIQNNLKTISQLNNLLENRNISLEKDVENLEKDRVLNKEISFQSFTSLFPDKDSCQKLLIELKWKNGFECNYCGGNHFVLFRKTDPYLRKCTKCGKIHSATTHTLFHNLKFPLEKAFYIVFLSCSTKKYSVEKIGEMIDLRVATVWTFKKKVEAAIEDKKFHKNPDMTWQDLIL